MKPSTRNPFSWQRVIAYAQKEIAQILRDPSSLIIAVILPLMMIFLFAYGVSLDMNNIKIGLVVEDTSPLSRSLFAAFGNNKYFKVESSFDRDSLYKKMMAAKIHGIVIIPQDFSDKLLRGEFSPIQVIADGSETNTATFVQNYADGIVNLWWQSQQASLGKNLPAKITPEVRIWFNEQLESRNVILPGSIAIIMALIGTLLTALVVAREWDNGTMETVLTTPIRMSELILAKLTPYFAIGLISMTLCVFVAVFIFQVPFVGSFTILFMATCVFLIASLGQGLLISTLAKNQFAASQAAINAAFLPAYMLSGFLYEIESMPNAIKAITYLLPARYFVSIIQTSFLAGVVWQQLFMNMLGMLLIALFFITMVYRKSSRQLE